NVTGVQTCALPIYQLQMILQVLPPLGCQQVAAVGTCHQGAGAAPVVAEQHQAVARDQTQADPGFGDQLGRVVGTQESGVGVRGGDVGSQGTRVAEEERS